MNRKMNMMRCLCRMRKWLFLFLMCCPAWILPQESDPPNDADRLAKNLYEVTALQVENLLLSVSPDDSLIFDLISDAKMLAEAQEWQEGIEILNTVLEIAEPAGNAFDLANELLTGNNADDNFNYAIDGPSIPVLGTSPRLQIEAGVDYAQQEFEISFFESDSVLVEELQNPYLSISYFQPFRLNSQQSFQLNHRLRLDNQYFNYSLFGTWEQNSGNRNTRFEFDGDYYHSQVANESHFIDGRGLFSIGNSNNPKNRWYIRARGRYKGHLAPDSLNRNIASANFNAYFEHFINYTHSFYLNWTPSFYRETTAGGYQYFQNRLNGMYRVWGSYNRFFNVGLEAIQQHLEDQIDASPYQNSYLSITPRLDTEWALTRWLGYEVRISSEQRSYETSDAISPDYRYLNLLAIQKFYFSDLKSIGIGYAGERQRHSVDEERDLELAEQADFRSNGLVLTMEYLNLRGAIINLEYRANWRSYPNASTTIFDSFYSDRMVHSISLFGWIPLNQHLQLQMFANYDNDQDRNNERNDNRNTLVNLGIIYKF